MTLARASIAGPLVGASALLGLAACAGEDASPDPLVVLVSIDTARADHTSLYGYERDTTPFLAELAQDALVFEEAYSPASWTLTAHATMLSGLQPDEHGIVEEELAFSPELPLLAEVLSERGVATAGFYYPSWVHPRFGMDRGFDLFVKHRDAAHARENLNAWLDAGGGEGPTFAFIHLFDVHSAEFRADQPLLYAPPPEYRGLFDPEAAAQFELRDPQAFWNNIKQPTPRQTEALVALYDAGLRYIDDWLRDLSVEFADRGYGERLTWLVTSDHGEALGDRLILADHGGMRPEGLRVPLLVRPAGGVAAGRPTALASLADLAPTIAGLFGLDGAADARGALGTGIDLLRFERGPDEPLRTEKGSQRGVVAPPLMGAAPVRWFDLAEQGERPQNMPLGGWWVDLELDRRGETELVGSHNQPDRFLAGFQRLVELRRQALASRLSDPPAPVPVREPTAEERAFLEALGYAQEGLEPSQDPRAK